MNWLGVSRLSPYSRGEDEGEEFKRARPASTLTLPSPFEKERRPVTHMVTYECRRKHE
jgi:hypothetical protein